MIYNTHKHTHTHDGSSIAKCIGMDVPPTVCLQCEAAANTHDSERISKLRNYPKWN